MNRDELQAWYLGDQSLVAGDRLRDEFAAFLQARQRGAFPGDFLSYIAERGLIAPPVAEAARAELGRKLSATQRRPEAATRKGSRPVKLGESSRDERASRRALRAGLKASQSVGPYVIEDEIGRGGMGVVYRARHRSLDRLVALKVLRERDLGSQVAVERFVREAKALARLEHPYIVDVYDIGQEDEIIYMAMAHIAGGTLGDRLKDRGPMSVEDAARMVEKLARAVEHAHQRQIIHRDIKPENVLFDESGEPRLTDFGLAKSLDASTQGLSKPGQILGTIAYMPPEQIDGQVEKVDARVDVYALGVTFYEMLTGHRPYEGASSVELFRRILMTPPTPIKEHLTGLPKSVEAVIFEAIAKDPDERFASAGELADACRGLLKSREPASASRPSKLRSCLLFLGTAVLSLGLGACLILGAASKELEGLRARNLALEKQRGATRRLLAASPLSGADLSGFDGRGADLSGARLVGLDLRRARLEGVDLSGAILEDCRLNGARLEGAVMAEARLYGCDLREASLARIDWSGARADAATRWPGPRPAAVGEAEPRPATPTASEPDALAGEPASSPAVDWFRPLLAKVPSLRRPATGAVRPYPRSLREPPPGPGSALEAMLAREDQAALARLRQELAAGPRRVWSEDLVTRLFCRRLTELRRLEEADELLKLLDGVPLKIRRRGRRIQGSIEQARAVLSRGFRDWSEGRFEDALREAQRAREELPSGPESAALELVIADALGDEPGFAEALQRYEGLTRNRSWLRSLGLEGAAARGLRRAAALRQALTQLEEADLMFAGELAAHEPELLRDLSAPVRRFAARASLFALRAGDILPRWRLQPDAARARAVAACLDQARAAGDGSPSDRARAQVHLRAALRSDPSSAAARLALIDSLGKGEAERGAVARAWAELWALAASGGRAPRERRGEQTEALKSRPWFAGMAAAESRYHDRLEVLAAPFRSAPSPVLFLLLGDRLDHFFHPRRYPLTIEEGEALIYRGLVIEAALSGVELSFKRAGETLASLGESGVSRPFALSHRDSVLMVIAVTGAPEEARFGLSLRHRSGRTWPAGQSWWGLSEEAGLAAEAGEDPAALVRWRFEGALEEGGRLRVKHTFVRSRFSGPALGHFVFVRPAVR